MNTLIKIIGALGIVAISFITTLWLLDGNASACPSGRVIALSRPFAGFSDGGVAYAKELTGIEIPGDAANAPNRSRLVLCEDGHLIGTGHTEHADIAKRGGGRYSHWGNAVIFSASDNSDPNTNGRTYVAVLPR